MKIRSFKYRIRMNRKFVDACNASLNSCRDLYNAALQQRREVYRRCGRTIGFTEQCKGLTEARELPEVAAILRTCQTYTLKQIDRAFAGFFRRVRCGEMPGYPRFKSSSRFNSITIDDARYFRVHGDKLVVLKIGSARLRLSRPVVGKPKQLTIKREFDGWYAILTCEVENESRAPLTGNNVGIDLGLEHFAVLSTGETVTNPRYFRQAENGLRRAQRGLSRKTRGSASRRDAKRLVQRWYAKVRRQRDWFQWQVARNMVRRFDVIAIEDLRVANLAKSRLAKSIHDAAWSLFISRLLVKAEDAGRAVIRVNPNFTSQDCSVGRRIRMSASAQTDPFSRWAATTTLLEISWREPRQ